MATASSIAPLPGSDNQTTRPFTVFRTVGVVLKDNAGRPIPGVMVRFTTGGAPVVGVPLTSRTGLTPVSDENGVAAIDTLIAGGPATVDLRANAESLGLSTQLTLTIAGKGPSYPEDHAGVQQTAPVNTAFPVRIQAKILDGLGGLPVPRALCSLSKPGTGAGGSFASAPGVNGIQLIADDTGTVTGPDIIANATPGTWELRLSCNTSSSTFTMTNLANGTVNLTPGGPYSYPLRSGRKPIEATVLDANGAPLAGRTVSFTYSYPGTVFLTSPRSAVSDARGVARVDVITDIDPSWVGIRASTPGADSVIVQVHAGAEAEVVGPKVQDMWWGGTVENGWGMSVIQHRGTLFAVIFGYDNAGKPTWWVMPGGAWNDSYTAYSGALYSPRGSPYFAYDPSRFVVGAAVGSMTLAFSSGSKATLQYTIDGVSGTRAVEKQRFSGAALSSGPVGLTDMWWGGAQQNGWGIAMIEQEATLFPVWYTYDGAGAPVWYIAPGGAWSGSTYTGRVNRTTSSPWVGTQYNASALKVIDVGSVSIEFKTNDTAVFTYDADGRTGTLNINRQAF